MEAAPRLDRRAHDDELRSALGRDARHLLGQASRACAHDLAPHTDAVRAGNRRRRLEPLLQAHELPVEVRVDRELPFENRRRDEDDPGAAVGGEAAGEVERVLRLLPVEQRHDDAPVGDRPRPAREAAGAVVKEVNVREPHRRS
jgi:hypothetical protein